MSSHAHNHVWAAWEESLHSRAEGSAALHSRCAEALLEDRRAEEGNDCSTFISLFDAPHHPPYYEDEEPELEPQPEPEPLVVAEMRDVAYELRKAELEAENTIATERMKLAMKSRSARRIEVPTGGPFADQGVLF